MPEPKIITDFPNCANCGSTEKISELGAAEMKEAGKIPKETFTSLRQNIIPLEQPMLAAVAVQCIHTFFDICAFCGLERCTRAEVIFAPIQMPPQNTRMNFQR